MKFWLTLFAFTCLLFLALTSSSFGQVLDRAPSGKQNYLPVEGGGIRMKIDSTTSLDSLLARLSKDWEFHETGKGYWIGYTEDMFSIAARGDAAIEPLLQIAKDSTNKRAREGAVYSLHLMGINRTIVGRFSEEFVNPNARLALLQLLKIPDLQEMVMLLLIRDPWLSDIPRIIDAMATCAADCWALTNGLTRYKIDSLPLHQTIPDNIQLISVKIKYTDPYTIERDFDFDAQIKEVLTALKRSGYYFIKVEDTLFKIKLTGDFISKFGSPVDIDSFFQLLDLDRYSSLGSRLQYYLEGGRLYICSPMTARKRLVNWWQRLTPEQKALYNKNKR